MSRRVNTSKQEKKNTILSDKQETDEVDQSLKMNDDNERRSIESEMSDKTKPTAMLCETKNPTKQLSTFQNIMSKVVSKDLLLPLFIVSFMLTTTMNIRRHEPWTHGWYSWSCYAFQCLLLAILAGLMSAKIWKESHTKKELSMFRMELSYFHEIIWQMIIMAIVMYSEQYLIFAVSFYDRHKYEYRPLQDNFRIGYGYLKKNYPNFHAMINWPIWFLVDGTLFCFVYLTIILLLLRYCYDWKMNDKSRVLSTLMGGKYMWTIMVTHVFRVMLMPGTVLPSSHKNCFRRRLLPQNSYFHMSVSNNEVTQTLNEMGLVSLWKQIFLTSEAKTYRGGGCNDLMFSGHLSCIVVSVCLFWEVCRMDKNDHYLSTLMVSILGMLAAPRMIISNNHYSVDCVAAFIISYMLWLLGSHPHSSLFFFPLTHYQVHSANNSAFLRYRHRLWNRFLLSHFKSDLRLFMFLWLLVFLAFFIPYFLAL